MRRIILVLIVVAVVGAVVGGVLLYRHRTSATKLIVRSELAVRAQQYDRALELADAAVAKEPGNWRTHYARSQALSAKGDGEAARQALAEAARHQPAGVVVELAVADTYAMPARRTLASAEGTRQVAVIAAAVEQFRQANAYLEGIKPAEDASALSIRQAIGFNLVQVSVAYRQMAARLDKEAATATAGGDKETARRKQAAQQAAAAEEGKAVKAALAELLAVVERDPKRDRAALVLVEQAVARRDAPALAAARRAILTLDDPPSGAAALLLLQDIRTVTELDATPDDSAELKAAADRLDALLAKHPENVELHLVRAEAALRLADTKACAEHCRLAMDAKPGQDREAWARLLSGYALMAERQWQEAEQKLHALKTDVPYSPNIQYAYALAAEAVGKKEAAREALRTVTRLEPDHAGALRRLAESLLAAGFAPEAFSDARVYYEKHPSSPDALRLYVLAAKQTSQDNLAREALRAALKAYPTRPEILIVAYEGWLLLEDGAAARQVLTAAAACQPVQAVERLAVARAFAILGRTSEAERLLQEGRARSPRDPRFPAELGRLYAATGRSRQAVEQYRAALQIDEASMASREALAAVLYDNGMFDECEAEVRTLLGRDPGHAGALWLRTQIRNLKGELPEAEMLAQVGGNERTALAMAMACLGRGQAKECKDICVQELKKAPANRSMRMVLGQACLALGDEAGCIAEWSAVLKESPAQLAVYLQLAAVLAKAAPPEKAAATLAAIPGAKPELVDLATGWLLERGAKYAEAAEVYGRLAARPDAPEDIRNRARLLRTQALARSRNVDQALTELDQVAGGSDVRRQALYSKAVLLVGTGRTTEAEVILAALRDQAVKALDAGVLERIVVLYVQMQAVDKALAVCDELQRLFPNDARPYLVRANVLEAAGKGAEVVECYRKAIERQPGNLGVHVMLARTFEADNRPMDALGALDQLAGVGETARVAALFERGAMLARWGLQSQAVECFEQLAGRGYAGDPALRLALGQAFGRLGRIDRAREILGRIPEYASQYVPARLALAALEEKDDARLAVLRGLRQARPADAAVAIREMEALLQAGRPEEAAKAFRDCAAAPAHAGGVSDELRAAGLRAMIAARDLPGAAALAARGAQESRLPLWRQLAALLASEDKPGAAAAPLPQPRDAGTLECVLGLVNAKKAGRPVEPWTARLTQIQQALEREKRGQAIPAPYRLLAALAGGSQAEAESQLAAIPAGGSISRSAAAELTASAAKNPKAADEAAALLRASLAMDLGLQPLGQAWAMQTLRARPACQWAAVLLLQTAPDATLLDEVARTLQPADSLVARTVQARLASVRQQNARAVDIWREALKGDPGNADLLTNLGISLERDGRIEEALAMYRQAWEAGHSPAAGNNAAYLTIQLHAKDPARLAEAATWMEDVVRRAPQEPAFRDTLGWVAHLQGRKEEAVAALRRAIRGLPDSPEVHFHLGQAEAAAGHADMARWHLTAAVNLVERQKADGGRPAASAVEAATLAGQALARLEKPRS